MAEVVFKPYEDDGTSGQTVVKVRVDQADDGAVDIVLINEEEGTEVQLLTITPDAGIELAVFDEQEAEDMGIMIDAQGYPVIKT